MKLESLPNLGATIVARLHAIGIDERATLQRAGPAAAYRQLCERAGRRRLPLCYYLYALEGALQGLDWRDLPGPTKDRLRREAGVD